MVKVTLTQHLLRTGSDNNIMTLHYQMGKT